MQENHGLNPQTYTWLLNSPYACIQALTLRNLLDKPASHQTLRRAQREAHQSGCIAAVLNQMHPNGYWAEPGAGYLPKYRSTVWSLILLAQLGAQARLDARITTAARYYLDQAFCEQGQIGKAGSPSHTVDCLQGNMLAALLDLGIEDERMEKAFDWMARSVTAEGLEPRENQKAALRYYSGKCGPNFACGANNQLPCAWGAVKVMLAFGKLPDQHQTPLIRAAIQQGINFLLAVDPASAAYPCGWNEKPSGNWWKFGFPVFYITDILQLVEALLWNGCAGDPRLHNALQLIEQKQDTQGRWALDYDYRGKTWLDFGEKKQPNDWVTYRAAWVLQTAAGAA